MTSQTEVRETKSEVRMASRVCVVWVFGPWVYVRGHTTWTMGEDRGPEIRLDLESVTQVDLLVGLTCVTDLADPNTYSESIVQTPVSLDTTHKDPTKC